MKEEEAKKLVCPHFSDFHNGFECNCITKECVHWRPEVQISGGLWQIGGCKLWRSSK